MNHAERNALIEKHFKAIMEISYSKGREYSNSGVDANANFHSDQDIGITPIQSCAVFLNKHYRSIRSWVRVGKVFSNESIEGRIHDAILYLFILLTLIHEEKYGGNKPKKRKSKP